MPHRSSPSSRTDGPSVWRAEKGRRRRESGWNGTEWMEGVLPPPSSSPPLLARLSAARTTALSGHPLAPPLISLERGHGADGRRTRTTEARRTEEGTKVGVERGPLPPSEESNRGAERRGKSKPTKLLLLPASPLFSSPLLSLLPHLMPRSPFLSSILPLPCGAAPPSSCPPFCHLTISFTPPSTE